MSNRAKNAATTAPAPRIRHIEMSGERVHSREVETGSAAFTAIEQARIAQAQALAAEFASIEVVAVVVISQGSNQKRTTRK